MSAPFARFFYIFFGALLVATLVLWFLSLRAEKRGDLPLKRMWRRWHTLCLVMAIFGFLWLFCREQHIYFLAMPFFFYLWCLIFFIWAVFNVRWMLTKMRAVQKERLERAEKEKYLP